MLYLFRTCALNLTNLPILCFVLSRPDLDNPCVPVVSHNRFIEMQAAEFAHQVEPNNPEANFRNILWTQNAEGLQIVDSIVDSGANKTFGVNSDEQITFLKQRYGSQCTTITHSYTNNKMLLRYHALCHIYKQDLGLIDISDWDQQLRTECIDLVAYYAQAFDEQNIIATQQLCNGDYDIPIKDFFDQATFFGHLKNLDAVESVTAKDFYQQWNTIFENYFKEKL